MAFPCHPDDVAIVDEHNTADPTPPHGTPRPTWELADEPDDGLTLARVKLVRSIVRLADTAGEPLDLGAVVDLFAYIVDGASPDLDGVAP